MAWSRSKKVAVLSATVVLGLAAVEGLVSFGLWAYDLGVAAKRPVAERRHTRYDPKLGWVNVPGAKIVDLYGRGRTLSINTQGFRGTEDYAATPPAGRQRVLFSGDSFVMGYGLDDAETLAVRMEMLEPSLQIVNMGQGGYGFGQMFLWYERDGRSIEHTRHLLGVNRYDLRRMRSDRFMGYGKPRLELVDGRPVATNTPVPQRAYAVPFLTQNLSTVFSLRTAELGRRLLTTEDIEQRISLAHAYEIAAAACAVMQHGDRAHGSELIVVWLPLVDEHDAGAHDTERASFFAQLRAQDITTIDLVDAFRRVPAARVPALFIDGRDIDYPGAAGHYSADGTHFFARALLDALGDVKSPERSEP